MKPIEFKEMNYQIAKEQPEYLTLPAHISGEGITTSCWQLTFKEKIKLLFTGKLYLQVMTGGGKLQPQKPCAENPLRA